MKEKTKENKAGFSGRLGFILTSAGAAVGLGNIYRFPYLAMKHGGMFVILYIILALTLGTALVSSEIAIGRKTGRCAVLAYGALDKRFSFLGFLTTLAPVLIFPYYCVIGGWVVKYTTVYIFGNPADLLDKAYFTSFRMDTPTLSLFFLVFLFLSALLVMRGVKGGVELLSKITMPPLLFLSLFLTVYILRAGNNGLDAIRHYLLPDVNSITPTLFLDLVGQIFYSLSIAMGTMVTFGAYMPRNESIIKSVLSIEFFDLLVALLSGIMISASVFSYTTPENVVSGPPLMFEALPRALSTLPFSRAIGSLFFLLILVAALTSSVALLETITSSIMAKLKISRVMSVIITLLLSIPLGFISVFGYSESFFLSPLGATPLDIFDYLANNILMPISALISIIFIGYVVKPEALSAELNLKPRGIGERLYSTFIKYIAPVSLTLVLLGAFF